MLQVLGFQSKKDPMSLSPGTKLLTDLEFTQNALLTLLQDDLQPLQQKILAKAVSIGKNKCDYQAKIECQQHSSKHI